MATVSPSGRGPLTGVEYPHDLLWDALRDVPDPELGVSLVDMGMIVDARREDARAVVRLTYTAMGCPGAGMIEEDVRARLLRAPGVEEVEIDVVWEPVWTTARLTSDGRDALLLLGVAL
ncbi:MAG TPA: metal-sulfur cluster assembly factor [Ktedonobacterales bacterium]